MLCHHIATASYHLITLSVKLLLIIGKLTYLSDCGFSTCFLVHVDNFGFRYGPSNKSPPVILLISFYKCPLFFPVYLFLLCRAKAPPLSPLNKHDGVHILFSLSLSPHCFCTTKDRFAWAIFLQLLSW